MPSWLWQEKLAAATPKPSKSDKKKDKKGDPAAEAEKAANIKKMEEEKAAARAKKKAAAEEAKKGPAAEKPACCEAAAAPAPAGAPAPAAGGHRQGCPARGGSHNQEGHLAEQGLELHCQKDAVPLLALTVARLAKLEVALKRVDAKTLPNGEAVLYLPLGRGSFVGADVMRGTSRAPLSRRRRCCTARRAMRSRRARPTTGCIMRRRWPAARAAASCRR